jgi:tetratricopeptide (TPR) repeat protein
VANWGDLWKRLGHAEPAPDVAELLPPLVAAGLVDKNPIAEGDTAFQILIHPGVAEAGRAEAGPELRGAVDIELAATWRTVMAHAQEQYGKSPEAGNMIVRSGLGAFSYLSRLGNWNEAWAMLELLDRVDFTPAANAAVLARMQQVVAATAGTEQELNHRVFLARLLWRVGRVKEGEAHMRAILDEAIRRQKFGTASIAASELGDFLRRTGQLDEALNLVEQVPQFSARAGYGPWTQLNDEVLRLEVLVKRGAYGAVLARVMELNEELKALPDPPGANEVVEPSFVRERACRVGFEAAVEQNAWQQALEFNAAIWESKRARGATPLDLAETEFGNYGVLLELQRYDEARDLLVHCREVFERENEVEGIGVVLAALADLEYRLDRFSEARNFYEAALRFLYITENPAQIATCHHNLASSLGQIHRVSEALVQRLAAILIGAAAQLGRAGDYGAALVNDLKRVDLKYRAALPADFATLCATVEKVEGVRFRKTVERLAGGPAECDELFQQATTALLELANTSE